MRKAAPEHENINAPLHFCKHQTAHRGQAFHFLFVCPLLRSLQLLGTSSEGVKITISRKRVLTRPDVGECIREVPPLEYLLVDEVAVVGTYEGFGEPTLLEERLWSAGEVDGLCFCTTGTPEEVVEVTRRPALLEVFSAL
jgi:hypothetical protein